MKIINRHYINKMPPQLSLQQAIYPEKKQDCNQSLYLDHLPCWLQYRAFEISAIPSICSRHVTVSMCTDCVTPSATRRASLPDSLSPAEQEGCLSPWGAPQDPQHSMDFTYDTQLILSVRLSRTYMLTLLKIPVITYVKCIET